MKRFLVAIIVVLMSTVVFAEDAPAPMVEQSMKPMLTGEDFLREAEKARLKAAAQPIFDAAEFFPEDRRNEVVTALAAINGLYVGETLGGCLVISDDEAAVRNRVAAEKESGGGGACQIQLCTYEPHGPAAICFTSCFSGNFVQYCCCNAMACCGCYVDPWGWGPACGGCYGGG